MASDLEGDRYRHFELDIENLLDKLCENADPEVGQGLKKLGERLINLYHKRLVKINHSVMELICAKPLIAGDYEVDVEHYLGANLTCDIYAVKGNGVLIVEVETGYTPPNHALDPYMYNKARIGSKIARYSSHSNKFALATPNYNILHIPSVFSKPPRFRTDKDVEEIKKLCDAYYEQPPITEKQIRESILQSIHILDIDNGQEREIDPEIYQNLISNVENPDSIGRNEYKNHVISSN